MATATAKIIRPQEGPQEAFLSTPADIAVYGGGAFGGKTWALLLEGMRHTANGEFGAVIFRRASPQITNEGGLWDESGKLYPLVGAEPKSGDLEWVFPSGACVSMRHLVHEKTKYDWQGTQICLLAFDELTHFSESQFFYLLSRNRSSCGVRPYVRATTNPDASSWVKRFLAPWVDRKYHDPAASGEVRYFIRVNGELVWSRDPADLAARFPGSRSKSVTFIRSSIYDNKIGMANDPDYLANLQAQGTVEQARLLHGDWDVANEGLVYPDFGRAVVETLPSELAGLDVGGIDWGFHNPFAAIKGVLDGDDVLWILWERHATRTTLSEHSKAMPRDGTRWWADPAGADQIAEMRHAGHDVIPCVHMGHEPMAAGIARVTDRLRSGRLKVLGSLGHLIDEAGKYRYEQKTDKATTEKPVDADNHALAALRYLIVGLDRGRAVEDRPPEETPEEQSARLAEAQKAKSDAWHDPENDAFFS